MIPTLCVKPWDYHSAKTDVILSDQALRVNIAIRPGDIMGGQRQIQLILVECVLECHITNVITTPLQVPEHPTEDLHRWAVLTHQQDEQQRAQRLLYIQIQQQYT